MRIPDVINECVVFLAYADGTDNVNTRATGFLVECENLPHLVTAKHNALKLGSDFIVRVNAHGGQYGRIPVSQRKWFFHPDRFVDVAVMVWGHNREIVQHKFVPFEKMATHQIVEEKDIGVGDDIVSGGYYYPIAGQERITPLVRCGTIAAMPAEKIAIGLLDEIGANISGAADAYLIEAKAIGGFSGAPVFVRRHIFDKNNPAVLHQFFWLLGLVHGHWELKNIPESFLRTLNEGIVHVVPSQKIVETLMQPELVERRKKIHGMQSQKS